MMESDEIIMAIDVGTNTEIDVGNREGIMATSCASGPAFEGMHIKYGMRAATGAIERVFIEPDTLEVHYKTIDDAPPVGICGSGLVDVIAEMFKTGIINEYGKINGELANETSRIRRGEKGYDFVLAWAKETGIDSDIVITQADVQELLKAKAAIHTGAALLMKRLGLTVKDIDKLVVAGAFGNYIDPESARIIGMYPEIPLNKIVFVGNAAGTGARMALISKEMRTKAEKIKEFVRYLELSADPDFAEEYMKSLFIPHADKSRFKEILMLVEKTRRKKT